MSLPINVQKQSCHSFSMSELSSATDNFDEKWCIGHGGFGKVYKGKTISDGPNNNTYAIKRAHDICDQGEPEFWVEVEMLSRLRHCNLVSLIGYCNEGKEMALVYEYMRNGTLYDHLHKKGTVFTWTQLLKICIGAARGLDYLHTGTGTQQGVIHRDVKTSNILLDQNYAAKIADFGLAKTGPTNQTRTYVSTAVKGTFGYMDPNYFYTGRLTRKSDVYAFGVVLLEVLSGRRALDESLDMGLVIWAQDLIKRGKLTRIISYSLKEKILKNSLKEFSRIVVRCLHSHPDQRPTMSEVVSGLVRALSFQERISSSTHGGITMKKVWSVFSLKGRFEVISSGEAESNEINVSTVISEGHKSKLVKRNLASNINTHEPGEIEAVRIKFYQPGSAYRMLKTKWKITETEAERIKLSKIYQKTRRAKKISHRDLALATNNFSLLRKLGNGGRGRVYKGYLSREGFMVAVKKISQRTKQGQDEYLTEFKMSNRYWHPYLMRLIGWCDDHKSEFLLVYDFFPNGSLESHLFSKKSVLKWGVRYKIATGLASALDYLHTWGAECVVHHNIKASNIMLDSNFNAKLGNFGLAQLIDDEVALKTDKEPDVYSFGMVVLEIVSGKKATDKVDPKSDLGLVEWVWKLLEKTDHLLSGVDPMLNNEFDAIEAGCLMMVGLWCTHPNRSLRPSICQAFQVLKFESALPNIFQ